MILNKTPEDLAREKAAKFPKSFYDLGNLKEVFNDVQLDAIVVALKEKAKRLKGSSKSVANSGYGSSNTLEKASKLADQSEYYEELVSAIIQNSI